MYANVPRSILDMLKGEPVDFIVRSAQDYRKRIIGLFALYVPFFLFSWVIIMPLMFSGPFFQVLLTGEATIVVNGTQETYTRSTMLVPFLFMIIPTLFSMIFIIPWVKILLFAIRSIRAKGSWYAGTNTHLIEITESGSKYYSWSQFSSRIDTKNHTDNSMDILLFLNRQEKTTNSIPINSELERQQNAINKGFQYNFSDLINQIPYLTNRIGLLRIPNGSFILQMIRHNMDGSHK